MQNKLEKMLDTTKEALANFMVQNVLAYLPDNCELARGFCVADKANHEVYRVKDIRVSIAKKNRDCPIKIMVTVAHEASDSELSLELSEFAKQFNF